MASLAAKFISKRLLGETVKNNFGTEDPYFEQVPATRLDGKPSSKTKKRRKALPPGISEHDGKVLTKVKRRAYRLDMSLFSCCGIRFGWGSVIGFIPAVGDVLDAFMAVMVMRTCQQVEGGLPAAVKSKMMFNIILDFFIGLVPFLGDLADAVFRANTRNAVELEKYLREKGAANLKAQGHQGSQHLDPSDPDEFDRLLNAEHGPPPQYEGTGHTQRPIVAAAQTQPQRPTEAHVPAERSSGGGGFFGFGRSKRQDVEHGTLAPEGASRRADEPLPNIPNNAPTRNPSTLQKTRR